VSRYRTSVHDRRQIYRVVRAGWETPLDTTFSQQAADSRWNTAKFPALYCCCSVHVARAVARDLFRYAGVEPADLQPAYRPRLIEVDWTGQLVDMASNRGIEAAGFPPSYPAGVDKSRTREAAVSWHEEGSEGVVCRSASLWRLGMRDWKEPRHRWSELAIFVDAARDEPRQTGQRDDLEWLSQRSEEPRG
jgi:RES domain-containing protein